MTIEQGDLVVFRSELSEEEKEEEDLEEKEEDEEKELQMKADAEFKMWQQLADDLEGYLEEDEKPKEDKYNKNQERGGRKKEEKTKMENEDFSEIIYKKEVKTRENVKEPKENTQNKKKKKKSQRRKGKSKGKKKEEKVDKQGEERNFKEKHGEKYYHKKEKNQERKKIKEEKDEDRIWEEFIRNVNCEVRAILNQPRDL